MINNFKKNAFSKKCVLEDDTGVTITDPDDLSGGNDGGSSSSGDPTNATFSNKTTADGLPSNTIRDVYADATAIYVATPSGLGISTDSGASFITRTTLSGLGDNVTNSVTKDSSGNLYVGTNNGVSISSDGGSSFTNYNTIGDGICGNTVFDTYVASNGDIFIATNGCTFNYSTNAGSTWTSRSVDGTTGAYEVEFYGSRIYTAHVSHPNGGMIKSSITGSMDLIASAAEGLGSNNVQGMEIDSSGTIYLATTGGLSISTDGGVSFVNKTTADGLPLNPTYGVFVDTSGYIYVAGPAGLSISINGGTSFVVKNTTDGLGSNDVGNVFVDQNGKIYLATSGGLSISD